MLSITLNANMLVVIDNLHHAVQNTQDVKSPSAAIKDTKHRTAEDSRQLI